MQSGDVDGRTVRSGWSWARLECAGLWWPRLLGGTTEAAAHLSVARRVAASWGEPDAGRGFSADGDFGGRSHASFHSDGCRDRAGEWVSVTRD